MFDKFLPFGLPNPVTKFRKNKSEIFMKMQQLSQKQNLGNETVVKVNGEERFWYDKDINF